MYKISMTARAEEELLFFKRTAPRFYKKALELLEDIEQHPYTGIGFPERLKYNFSGCWSRRISREHRLVYHVNDETITVVVLAMRDHYA